MDQHQAYQGQNLQDLSMEMDFFSNDSSNFGKINSECDYKQIRCDYENYEEQKHKDFVPQFSSDSHQQQCLSAIKKKQYSFDYTNVNGNRDKIIYFDGHPNQKKSEKKNILRNFGNAQNKYILSNLRARELIKGRVSNPEAFDDWVRSLSFYNFKHFQEIWKTDQKRKDQTFRKLYRELCWNFYEEQAIPYSWNSKMMKRSTKISHIQQISFLLDGVVKPDSLKCFKNFL